jgi:sorbitol-specific phosphotransferase system component IIC
MDRFRRAVTTVGALFAMAAPAAACPYCAVSQGADTLLYIAGFLAIPYAVVSVVWFFMRRILASEQIGAE